MESVITLQDAANIATYVAPGYFTIRMYSVVYAKRDKEFSRLLLESVVISLPIVAFTNWFWEMASGRAPAATSAHYALVLLGVAAVLGMIGAQTRVRWPVRQLADKLGFGEPDEDFVRSQLAQLKQTSMVTITLKNGEIFSGTPGGGSIYAKDTPREYYFTNIAWYDKSKSAWDNRPGGLILNLEQVEYIETP